MSDQNKYHQEFSPLVAIPVCEARSGQIEALSSYFIRLAKYHRLSMRELFKYCFPELNRKYVQTKQTSKNAAAFLNGYHCKTVDVQKRMEGLLHVDVRSTTLIAWKPCFSHMRNDVFAMYKRWCPLCLREAEIRHEKLVWFLKEYKVCVRHNTVLIDKCFKCGNYQPVLSNLRGIGYCHHCNYDLSDEGSIIDDNDHRSAWVESLIGLAVSNFNVYQKLSFDTLFKSLINQTGVRGVHSLEKLLGFGNSTLRNWSKGRARPSLTLFLEFSEALGVRPDQLILGEFRIDLDRIRPRTPLVFSKTSNKEKQYIERYLRKLLFFQKDEIPVARIVKRLGVSSSFLYYYFNDHMKKISFNNRCIQIEGKIRSVSLMRAEIARAIKKIRDSGCYPAHNKVMAIVCQDIKKGFPIGSFSCLWRMELYSQNSFILNKF